MHRLILILLLSPSISFSQEKEVDATNTEDFNAQVRRLNLAIDSLIFKTDENKKNMQRLKLENDELRKLLREYIIEIDSLFTVNLHLLDELDKCESSLKKTMFSEPRKLIQGIENSVFNVKESCTLTFDLTVNQSGYPKKVEFIPSKSTEDDKDLIREVSEAIRYGVKYEFREGVEEEVIRFVVNLVGI